MKKIKSLSFVFLSIILITIYFGLCCCNINSNNQKQIAISESSYISYAKAKENCFLFKTSDVTNSNYNNVFFIVPKTYFVTVLNRINSYILKVQYKNKVGYVSSDSVSLVSFVPQSISLDGVTFDTLDSVGTHIRTSPNADDVANIITIIPAGSTSLNYISYIYGGVPNGGNSNIWYYAQYQPINDPTSVYEGYIYSEKTQNLAEIKDNTEGLADGINDSSNSENDEALQYSQLNDGIKTILIIIICLPILIIFVILIFGSKSKANNKQFEYDENKMQNFDINKTRKSESKASDSCCC